MKQFVKGHQKINGVSTPGFPINDATYTLDKTVTFDAGKHYIEYEDTPGWEVRACENELGERFIYGGGDRALDEYLKFKAAVHDTNGTIVAQKEGYWIQYTGTEDKPKPDQGGFDP